MNIGEIQKKTDNFRKPFEISFYEINKQIEKYKQKQIKCIDNINKMHRYNHYLYKYGKCNDKIAELTNINSINQTKLGNLLGICSAQKEECLKQKQDLFEKLKTNIFCEGIKIIRLIKILAKYKKKDCDRILECKCALEQLQTLVIKKYSVFINNQ